MKKGFLLLSTMLGLASLTQAQKLALYEEFSGENCGPCAAYNPDLMTKLNANPTKVLLIKYQSPIPSAGPIYYQNTADVQSRMSYYSVPFAPYGRINGVVVGTGTNAGNITLTTQAMIDAAAAESTPFTLSIGTPTITGSNFSVTVTVTATSAVSNTGLKLRFALVEDLEYSTPPGTNGETSFHHVMRKMYPDAAGTTVQSAFAVGGTQVFTVTGTLPSYTSAENPNLFVAWIQDDANKTVLQAAKSANLPTAVNAVASEGLSLTNNLMCGASGSYNAVVTMKNTGTATLTSAKLYYKVGTGAYNTNPQSWAGSLAPGATTTVTISGIPVTTTGASVITDSIAMPNNQVDPGPINNTSASTAYLLNSVAVSLPISNDMETVKTDWVSYAPPTNGNPMYRVWYGNSSVNIGHNSVWALYFRGPQTTAGTQGYYIFPKATLPAGLKALDFYQSYAMRGSLGDKLEVVYSTDCGATWMTAWSKADADLATTTPTASNAYHIPTSSTWVMRSVDMTNVPDGAIIAFRATSGGGNYIFVDDIQLRTGATTGIEEHLETSSLRLYPNPVENTLNVAVEMKKSEQVTFAVVNALGQEVKVISKDLNAGNQTVSLDASDLAAGMYILNIKSVEGATQQKFLKK